MIDVIIPCFNEESNIVEVLESLEAQTYKKFVVRIIDGASTDRTREVVENYIAKSNMTIEILYNPKRTTPSSLNLGVRSAKSEYIIRLDGHSKIKSNYIQIIAHYLLEENFDVVGPQITYYPSRKNLESEIISTLLNSKFGNGGGKSRNKLQNPVRTEHAVMSCYRRAVWQEIGGYDEFLNSNEDFDFDYRANRAGFKVYSLPEPVYYAKARGDLRSFAQQRFRYGFWKAQVLKKDPASLRVRQILPIVFTLTLVFSIYFPPFLLFFAAYLSAMILSMGLKIHELSQKFGVSSFKVSREFLKTSLINHCVWSLGVICGLLFLRRKI